MPPDGPSGRPAARASAVRGSTPMPSTTTSAGYSSPAAVATARARPSSSVRIFVTSARETVRIPMRFIALCTRPPMSGSSVAIGCAPRCSTVTS